MTKKPAVIPPVATLALRAYRAYVDGGRVADLDHIMQDMMEGEKGMLPDGTVITVFSVANAGFNGMQISGRTAEGTYRVTYWR